MNLLQIYKQLSHQLPGELLDSLKNVTGFNRSSFEQVHQSGEQVTSIRLNPGKLSVADCLLPIEAPVSWSANGFYLTHRPSFILDPLIHAGGYYVQEASSMFIEEALKQTIDLSKPLRVLDLCAAPGGKSTLIQSIISNDSLLVSNEVIKTRVNILSENITKWGASNVVVTNNDPKDFRRLGSYFDVIVVDAPCSGSGLFRKDPDAISEWSEQNVELCSQRQQRILADILPTLKEDGILIYSTCSYSESEDEQICDWLLNNNQLTSIPLRLKEEWGIVETTSAEHNAYGYRFYPDKVKGEGLFIAAFKKNDGGGSEEASKKKYEKLTAKEIDVVKPWLKEPDNFFFIKQNDEAIAIPKLLENDFTLLQSCLYIKKAGVRLGSVIRNELIPDHELALSTIISKHIQCHEVDKETALQYLRRQDITLDTAEKGWLLLSFQQLPLGWVKNLPNRVNNYYPKQWRILHN